MKTKAELAERLPSSLFHLIHEMIGKASMCWQKPEEAGIFKSEEASNCALELCEAVADFLESIRAKQPADTSEVLDPAEAHRLFTGLNAASIPSQWRIELARLRSSYELLQEFRSRMIGLWVTDTPWRVYDPGQVMFRVWHDNSSERFEYTGQFPRPAHRPVHFKYYREPANGQAGAWYSGSGRFIRWADSFERFQVGPGNLTVALVEDMDGQVFKVDPGNMQFIDVPGASRLNNDLRNPENQMPGYEVKELSREEVKDLFGKKDQIIEHAWRNGLDYAPVGKIVEARFRDGSFSFERSPFQAVLTHAFGDACYQDVKIPGRFLKPEDIEWRINPAFEQ